MSGNAELQEWNASARECNDQLWPLAYADWIEDETSRSKEIPEVTRRAIRKCPDLVEYVKRLKPSIEDWDRLDGVRFYSREMFRWRVAFIQWPRPDEYPVDKPMFVLSYDVPMEYHSVINLIINTWYMEDYVLVKQLTQPVLAWLARALEMTGGKDLYMDMGNDMTVMEFYTQEGYSKYVSKGVPTSLTQGGDLQQ